MTKEKNKEYVTADCSSESKDLIFEASAQKDPLLITIEGQPEKEVYVERMVGGMPRRAKVDYHPPHRKHPSNTNPLYIQRIKRICTKKGTLLYDVKEKPIVTGEELNKINNYEKF